MIKFPKNIIIEITDEKDKITKISVRPYLLNSEIEIISEQVENIKSKLQRKNIVETLVMRFCTDIEDFNKDEINIQIIDVYRVNGIIEKVMDCLDKDSYFIVNELIDIEVGNELRTIKLLINDLIESVNKIEDGSAQNALKDAIATLQEADNQLKLVKGK